MDDCFHQPPLVLLARLPGTGKTTLAYALARQLGWIVLDKDLFNGVLLDADMDQEQAAPLAYQLLFTLAEDLLVKQCSSVILDSAGRQPFILQRAKEIAKRSRAWLKVIRCVAPQPVLCAPNAWQAASPDHRSGR
jgi:predicted kinase